MTEFNKYWKIFKNTIIGWWRSMIFPQLHITVERWKWNEKYGVYVSTEGNIRDKNKKLRSFQTGDSYLKTTIHSDSGKKKRMFVHRLVLDTFRPVENEDEMTVDHLNHNKRDNRLKNLEWVSEKENLERAAKDRIYPSKNSSEEVKYLSDYDKQQLKKDLLCQLNSNFYVPQHIQYTFCIPKIGEVKWSPESIAEFILSQERKGLNAKNQDDMVNIIKRKISSMCASVYGYQLKYKKVED